MIIETDLIEFFSERLKNLEAKIERSNLTNDDVLFDYLSELLEKFLIDNNLSMVELNTLIIGNWLIQNMASTPYNYKVIETRETEN